MYELIIYSGFLLLISIISGLMFELYTKLYNKA